MNDDKTVRQQRGSAMKSACWYYYPFVPSLFFVLISLTFACFSTGGNTPEANTQVAENEFSVPPANINLLKPLEISQKPEDVALAKKIDEIIETSEFASARWGVFVISLKDGRVSAARDAQKLFNPASTQKILTSVVALDALGADFRWQTKIFSVKEIENGILDGDLILYGHGAPDFSDASLDNLVNQLAAKNLKTIKGNVIGDDSFFKGDNLGDGWTWNDIQWYYGAEASALSINLNQATVTLTGGKPNASTEFVQISGAIQPIEDIEAVGLKRGLGDNQIYVWGNANNLNARVAVNNPALLAAKNLKAALEKRGIKIEGEAKSADWKSENKADIAKAFELASVDSQTLGEVVRRMNKDSVNLYAELILRSLGKRFGETAPDENARTQKLRGDDAAGASVMKRWLTEKNVATDEVKIHDGSGLSRLDFVTPETIGRALVYAAQSPFADVFKNSLPVAGTDGTLRGRLGNVRGKILGKTGSITYVNTLAGYAKKSNDETFAFVIFCNNQTRKADSSGVIDSIATILAE
jgi:serine-type D-Ala-D-Ala carboxypeptidase/endopeptidase (penicillin-binding protein 4)